MAFLEKLSENPWYVLKDENKGNSLILTGQSSVQSFYSVVCT